MSSFARKTLPWLGSWAAKTQDQLAALGLDRPIAQPNEIPIRAKENMGFELIQTQNNLTAARLLMEGHLPLIQTRSSASFVRPLAKQELTHRW